jgi:hypothetical protein
MISNILMCVEEKRAGLDNTYYKWRHDNFLGTKKWKKNLDTFLTQTQNCKACVNNLPCAHENRWGHHLVHKDWQELCEGESQKTFFPCVIARAFSSGQTLVGVNFMHVIDIVIFFHSCNHMWCLCNVVLQLQLGFVAWTLS